VRGRRRGGATAGGGPAAVGGGGSRGGPATGFRDALAFLTPLGGPAGAGPGALVWFPVVGALVGLGVGATWWAAARLWPMAVAAALAVAADLGLTGMLHVDGLCDSADGLLAPMARERRLEVMAAPDIGAFGATATVTALLLRWTCLAVLHPAPLLLGGLWATSRTWMAVVMMRVPYARPGGGLATAFLARSRRAALVPVATAGTVVALALVVGWRPLVGPVAAAAATLAAAATVWFAWRRLGGFTGDVLGAAGVVGETTGLLVACAKW